MSSTNFSKVHEAVYDDAHTLTFHCTEFGDAVVINVMANGIIDSTFSIVPRPLEARAIAFTDESDSEDDETGFIQGPEPELLVGNHGNIKIQVVAAEIAKLLCTFPCCLSKEKIILSIGLILFEKQASSRDFDLVMFILLNLKLLIVKH